MVRADAPRVPRMTLAGLIALPLLGYVLGAWHGWVGRAWHETRLDRLNELTTSQLAACVLYARSQGRRVKRKHVAEIRRRGLVWDLRANRLIRLPPDLSRQPPRAATSGERGNT